MHVQHVHHLLPKKRDEKRKRKLAPFYEFVQAIAPGREERMIGGEGGKKREEKEKAKNLKEGEHKP